MNLSWSPAVPDKRFIETRVLLRVPSRVFADELLSDEVCIASVVQRIRTPPCHGGGSGFDPRSTLAGVPVFQTGCRGFDSHPLHGRVGRRGSSAWQSGRLVSGRSPVRCRPAALDRSGA
jgi:hypothetical protein